MNNQRLRNLTTKRLHNEMSYIYEDIEHLTGMPGIMTHMLPNAIKAMMPWLKGKVTDSRFWDGKLDPSHCGDYNIKPMTANEQKEFKDRYRKLPCALGG